MIALIERHALDYPHHRAQDRLEQASLTPAKYRRLSKSHHEQAVRESAIPEEDVKAALQFIVKHPDVGAGKAHMSLIDGELAYISSANLNRIKQLVTQKAAEAYKQRKEKEKLLEAQLREDLRARQKTNGYLHQRARYPNHIWAIDYVTITFMGIPFALCVVYDEYSQAYLSLHAGFYADQQLATTSLREAIERTQIQPKFVRRDNGKPFETEAFQRQLETVKDYPVPPHSPWYNGSLESCNKSLKAAVRTRGMQEMADNPDPYRKARQDPEVALAMLQDHVDEVRVMLNEVISRGKHGMPPAKVFSKKERETRARHQAFTAKKKQHRRERMAAIRANPNGKHSPKTLLAKAESITKRILGGMETNALYVLDEVLHHRFRMFET